ncbi:hypothetical protein G6O67_000917 [Ophiocordyceps sinensis]|uniref:Uncharacterized protein n=1 Tax=Ophiocordyceps sinensis TaxID=72228 RepID=A0A8H4Q070_9HYPO|nr:hypothetical protein G6O67_000917 [Ophiocordyceps sinensis]
MRDSHLGHDARQVLSAAGLGRDAQAGAPRQGREHVPDADVEGVGRELQHSRAGDDAHGTRLLRDAGAEGGMFDDDAFGAPGAPGRVYNVSRVTGLDVVLYRTRSSEGLAQEPLDRSLGDDEARRRPGRRVGREFLGHERHGRAGVVDDAPLPVRGMGRIDGHKGAAGLDDGEHGDDCPSRLEEPERHHRAPARPLGLKPRGQQRRQLLQPRVGQVAVPRADGRGSGSERRGLGDLAVDARGDGGGEMPVPEGDHPVVPGGEEVDVSESLAGPQQHGFERGLERMGDETLLLRGNGPRLARDGELRAGTGQVDRGEDGKLTWSSQRELRG